MKYKQKIILLSVAIVILFVAVIFVSTRNGSTTPVSDTPQNATLSIKQKLLSPLSKIDPEKTPKEINYPDQPKTTTTEDPGYCTADKYCYLIYTKSTENEPCEPCPPNHISDDFICGTIKDSNNYINAYEAFNIACEKCGIKPKIEVNCNCENNKCEKIF